MTTLGEVYDFVREQRLNIELFGAEDEATYQYTIFCKELGKTILAELGITQRETLKKLPQDTELGEKALEKFTKLKLWVSENFSNF